MNKSIILVDFDNIFLGLWNLDPDLALRFANLPDVLLEALAERYLVSERRRWLVARCYLNPAGYVIDGRQEDGSDFKRFFSRFRPLWVSAGFEVVDTPTLARDKNAADIRIVIDALDLLQHPTGFDEFVIASGDSDFTPLLHRLRAHGRGIAVLSPGNAARAYVSVADRVLNFEAIGDLLRPPAVAPVPVSLPAAGCTELAAVDLDDALDAFALFVQGEYNEATRPLNFAQLSQKAAAAVPGLREARWGGNGFAAAVAALQLPNARLDQYHLWDEERHEPPSAPDTTVAESDLPELIDLLARVVDLPRLPAEAWPVIFKAIAEYLAEYPFNLAEITRAIRDQLADSPTPVGRAALNFVVRGAHFGGAPLTESPAPGADEIAQAFLANLIQLAYDAGVNLDSEDQLTLSDWFGIAAEEGPGAADEAGEGRQGAAG